MKRIRAALHTNDVQVEAAVILTLLNLIAFVSRDDHPIWLGVAAFLFWPLLAFIFNLIDPIPK